MHLILGTVSCQIPSAHDDRILAVREPALAIVVQLSRVPRLAFVLQLLRDDRLSQRLDLFTQLPGLRILLRWS